MASLTDISTLPWATLVDGGGRPRMDGLTFTIKDLSNVTVLTGSVNSSGQMTGNLAAGTYTATVLTTTKTVKVPPDQADVDSKAEKLRQLANVKDPIGIYAGATGDGTTDDTPSITAWAATGRPLFFPDGNYKFNGAAPLASLSHPVMVGAGPSKTKITLTTGYFMDDTFGWVDALWQGITFTGGVGALRCRYTGVNVNGPKVVQNCQFLNFTGAAVSSNSSDEPYWTFEDSLWQGANATTTMCVALNGYSDSCVFERCHFLTSRIGIKLVRSNTVRIHACDFIPYIAGTGGTPRVKVWIVPQSDGGYGCRITDGKFGSESASTGDWHVVLAGEGAGTYNGDRMPDFTTAQTNPVTGLKVDMQYGGTGTNAPPPIYSLTTDLQGCMVKGTFVGTKPAYSAVQFATAPTAPNRLMDTNVWGPLQVSDTETVAMPPATNSVALYGHLEDPAMLWASDFSTPQEGPGDAADFTNLSPSTVTGWGSFNATKTNITDRLGGADAIEQTITGDGGVFYAYMTTPTVGRPAWLEMDIKQGASSPLALVEAGLQFDTAVLIMKRVVAPPAAWGRLRIPLTFNSTGANILVTVKSLAGVTSGTVQFGRVKVYHARSPLSLEPVFPIAQTTTTAPGAGGAGALPATPLGYTTVYINGTARKIPYY